MKGRAKRRGRPPLPPALRKVEVGTRLIPDFIKRGKRAAKRAGVSFGEFLTQAAERFIISAERKVARGER